MSSITANQEMLNMLRQATGPVDVLSADGDVIAHLTPVAKQSTRHKARAIAAFIAGKHSYNPFSDGDDPAAVDAIEQQLIASNGKTYTLVEVYEHLLSITPEPLWRDQLQKLIDRLKERDRCDTQ